jgi:protein-S-isoprenylcysteine O-methyltransferase Ste14
VTLNNLRIFLLAIMGTFIEPALRREEQALQKQYEDAYGQFNEHGDLFLEVYEIQKI